MWTNSDRPVLVLGLGNPIMGDDGVGIVALEQFRERFEVFDGGRMVQVYETRKAAEAHKRSINAADPGSGRVVHVTPRY